eukprot:scaffold1068_cov167-Amphora_coffeaeformis.AAC.42
MFPNKARTAAAAPLLQDSVDGRVDLPEEPSVRQLRAMVTVRLPQNGGRLERVKKRGKRVFLERDRHGDPKRILWVDRAGKVFAEMRDDDENAVQRNTIRLGLGDFIFYSVLVAKAAQYSFATFAACIDRASTIGIQHPIWTMSNRRKIEEEDGLFSCCSDGGTACVTTVLCGSFVPTIIAAFRMGWPMIGVFMIAVFVVFFLAYTSLVSAATPSATGSTANQELDPAQATSLMYLYGSIFSLAIVLACMRTALLKRHGRADGDGCGSCLQAFFCAPCLAAQMMRWTDGRFEKYNAVAKSVGIEMHNEKNTDLV